MRRKLNDKEIESLREEVQQARSVTPFKPSLTSIAKKHEMCLHTLLRYTNEEYRELSRKVSKDRYYFKKNEEYFTTIMCDECKEATKNHKRCPYCTILKHDDSECFCQSKAPFNFHGCVSLLHAVFNIANTKQDTI